MAKTDNKVDFAGILCQGWRAAVRQQSYADVCGLDDNTLRELTVYFGELDKWRRKINLVARAEPARIIENHFLDSLTLLPELTPYKEEEAPSLLDIGSGAGFPGLVIKIACPWLRVILVEPRQKRVSFLQHIIRSLQLTNITVREERLAEDKRQFQENYGRPNIITSRAVADIRTFLQMLTGAPAGSKIICMKGPGAAAEIEAWQNSPDNVFTIVSRRRFVLPVSGAARELIVFTQMDQENR
ncbi:MAG: 16S rRNA (guanine(527)-N(7))-methyltransferase RsmG [Deltaproteobacteria bacterium]|nr:16S rRNA (guanine(527)-N(7))-methyltransferase RsmG [Deltaproteobacteria bacterium]